MTPHRMLSLALLVVATCVAGSSVVRAHHSHGNYADTFVDIEGVVREIHFVNPHSWIHLRVSDGTTWRVEGGAPSALLRRGWNRNSLPAGTDIIVDAFRARDGDTRASAAEIRFPNGRELSLGNPTTEAVAAAARRAGGN